MDDSVESPEIASRRLRILLDLVWAGNQARMARDLDVNPASLSRFLRGKHMPGYRLLTALASKPSINIRWFLTGEGDPLIEGPAVGRFRPVADALLPGPPDEHPDLLSGLSYPIAEAFNSPTSYWLRASRYMSLLSGHTILGSDLLLMETSPVWTRKGHALFSKICGFRAGGAKATRFLLARVEFSKDHMFDNTPFNIYAMHVADGRAGESSSRATWKLVVPGPSGELPRLSHKGPVRHVTPDDIVGVCVALQRSYVGQRTLEPGT